MAIEKFKLKGTKYVIEKDPDSILDYVVDFTDFLTPVEDNIDSVEVVQESGGVSVESTVIDGKIVTAWVSGGEITVAGAYASATFRITTDNTPPRVEDRTLYFDIKER
jgi:hypothetical protein